MTNFNAVATFNTLIGNKQGNLSDLDWEALEAQFKLIQEEFEETRDKGLKAKDITELRDGICDLLVTTYGLAHRAGIDADLDMQEVCASNMSKFCQDNIEALETGTKYEKMGVQVNYRKQPNGMIAVTSATNQIGSDGKEYPRGKLLKSINFKEPQFS